MKKILIILTAIIVLLSISCEEEINHPCGDDIEISVVVNYGCDSVFNDLAENSLITFTKNISNNELEFLDSGRTINGNYVFSPDESGCGISNITIRSEYLNLQPQFETIDYICQDTTIEFNFDTCLPDTNQVNCEELDKSDDLLFIDDLTGEECIFRNAPSENTYYFRTASLFNANSSDCDIIIEGIGELVNYNRDFQNGRFRLKQPFTFTRFLDGNNAVIPAGERIDLTFEFLSDELGQYTEVFNYNLSCEGNDCVGDGVWNINLEAEVCEPTCNCPFNSEMEEEPIVEAPRLEVGEEFVVNNYQIRINNHTLINGCYLMIDEIVRIDDSRNEYVLPLNNNPYNINPANGVDDWIFTNQVDLTRNYYGGEEIDLSFRLSVNRMGELRDTFRIKTTVYDQDGVPIDDAIDCFYDFYLEGHGCQNGCASLLVDHNSTWEVNEVNTSNLGNNKWDTLSWQNPRRIESRELLPMLSFSNPNEVFYDFPSTFSLDPECSGKPNRYKFEFEIQLDESIEYCELPQRYTVEVANPYPSVNDPNYREDLRYFSSTDIVNAEISDNGRAIELTVEFTAPTYDEIRTLRTIYPNKNEFRYRVFIRDNNVENDCHIALNFRTVVSDLPIPGPIRQLYAYSQVSSKQQNPDFMAVKIDTLHPDGYWGVDKNQVLPRTGNFPTTDDSFFLNVPDPSSLNQLPLLNLVPSSSNTFKNIRRVDIPIHGQIYPSNNAFIAGYADLINSMFDVNDCFILTPDRIYSDFNGINGYEVQAGEVYAVWSDEEHGGNLCDNPCHLALIYIYETSTGLDVNNQSDIANIRYRIVYPINK